MKASTALGMVVGWLAMAGGSIAATSQVEICHFPPGNPATYQTITVGAPALRAHLAHGDFAGACANDCRLFGSVCNDGDACTADACKDDGTCAHTSAKDCDDGNPCTNDGCNPVSGACQNAPKVGLTYCDDGDTCTAPDVCTTAGTCNGTAIAGCCDSAADCDDGDACTRESCVDHACQREQRQCGAPDRCSVAACNPTTGACEAVAKDCSDGDPCTHDTCNCTTGSCDSTPDDECGTDEPSSALVCPSPVGDGRCDAEYNDPAHDYDGGDCCPGRCSAGRRFACGSAGYDCRGFPLTAPNQVGSELTIARKRLFDAGFTVALQEVQQALSCELLVPSSWVVAQTQWDSVVTLRYATTSPTECLDADGNVVPRP